MILNTMRRYVRLGLLTQNRKQGCNHEKYNKGVSTKVLLQVNLLGAQKRMVIFTSIEICSIITEISAWYKVRKYNGCKNYSIHVL